MIQNKMKYTVILIIVLLSLYSLSRLNHHANADQSAILVEVMPVKKQAVALEVQAVGALVAAQNVQIAPEIAGQIAKVFFKDGADVKQGAPLFQLNDAVFKAKLDSATATYHLSEGTFHRMKLLANKGIISQQDLEKAEADLKEKKAVSDEMQAMLQQMLLVAPFDGVLAKSTVSLGDYVTVGQSLVLLTDTHHLHVEYNVSEKYLASLKIGQTIKITTSAYPGKTFAGEVAYISPTINTQDRTLSVYAEVPNPNAELASGLFVNVTQSLGMQENVLVVPAASLVATIDGYVVMKVVEGKVVTVPVEIGQRSLNQVQILRGLDEKDQVIVAGQQKIRDGVSVKVKV